MRKTHIAGIAAVAAVMIGGQANAQAATPITVDSAVEIGSGSPVPGGFTAGYWNIANYGQSDAIPAGTTYTVKFNTVVPGVSGIGSTTVTAPVWSGLEVKRVSNDTYTVTVLREIAPGVKVSGVWSMADTIFNPRATVKISTTLLARGAVDTAAANDTATYTNYNKGF